MPDRPLPYVTRTEGAAKERAQARYRAVLPLVQPVARAVVEDYTRLLERDLLADFDRWARIHERELSPDSVLRKWVSQPSGVGYLDVAHLRQPGQIRDSLAELLDRNATAIVVDVRDAPGGSVEQTVSVASEFIKAGPVMQVTEHGSRRVYEAIGNGLVTDPSLRLVALQSRFTSSAAEALLAALRHHRRATLIGEATFGKTWLWQRRSDGTEVRTGTWYSPSGELLTTGVAPDVAVDDARDGEQDAILAAAYEWLEAGA